jgi:hypothetical protein
MPSVIDLDAATADLFRHRLWTEHLRLVCESEKIDTIWNLAGVRVASTGAHWTLSALG